MVAARTTAGGGRLDYTLLAIAVLGSWVGASGSRWPTRMGASARDLVAECRRATGATASDYEAIVGGAAAHNMAGKCLRACLMKHFKLMKPNGKFNGELAMQIATRYITGDPRKMKTAVDIINVCATMPVSANHCEAAEQYRTCAVDSALAPPPSSGAK